MTHQLDMMPSELVNDAVLERIAERLPKARQVTAPRLLKWAFAATGVRYPFGTDVGHELVLPERAREDHR